MAPWALNEHIMRRNMAKQNVAYLCLGHPAVSAAAAPEEGEGGGEEEDDHYHHHRDQPRLAKRGRCCGSVGSVKRLKIKSCQILVSHFIIQSVQK